MRLDGFTTAVEFAQAMQARSGVGGWGDQDAFRVDAGRAGNIGAGGLRER
jgi:hypothetical protein